MMVNHLNFVVQHMIMLYYQLILVQENYVESILLILLMIDFREQQIHMNNKIDVHVILLVYQHTHVPVGDPIHHRNEGDKPIQHNTTTTRLRARTHERE